MSDEPERASAPVAATALRNFVLSSRLRRRSMFCEKRCRRAWPSRAPDLPRETGGRSYVFKLKNSLWVGWTFTIFLNWVAFIWIGCRVRNWKHIAYGVAYLGIVVTYIVVANKSRDDSMTFNIAILTLLGAWIASITQAFVIRGPYVERLRSRQLQKRLLARRTLHVTAVAAPRVVGTVSLASAVRHMRSNVEKESIPSGPTDD